MLLSAVDLVFAYDHGRRQPPPRVIDGVSIAVGSRDIVGILGPNGSGKTTLLRLMAGFVEPQAGDLRLDGRRIGDLPRRERARRIAVVPQDTSLAFDYTVLEMVLMGRYPHLGPFEIEGPDDLAAAMAALESTGTAALADRSFQTLSGGERQRVVIASAIAQLTTDSRPVESDGSRVAGVRLLLLDEPTASLDLKYQFEVGSLLTRLHAALDLAIVVSTHDLRFAASLCTRIVLLGRGRILAEGPPREVLRPDLVGRLFDVEPALTEPILAAAHPR